MQAVIPLIAAVLAGCAVGVPTCPRNATLYDRTALLAQLGCGYDPKRVTSFDDGFRAPVIALTDNLQKLQLPYPSTVGVPLPCEASRNYKGYPGDPRVNIDKVFKSYSEFRTAIGTSSSFGVGIINFLASLGSSKTLASVLKQESVTVFKYRAFRQAEASLPVNTPAEVLAVQNWWDPDFANAVKDLHAINSSDSSYKDLINGFGTHIVSRVVVGGFIAVHANMDYCEYTVSATSKGSAEFQSELLQDLTLKAKVELGISTQSVTSKLSSFVGNQRIGGNNTAYLKTGDINQYIAGTPKEKTTGVISQGTQFVGIWNLLPTNDKRRALLEQAVEAYLGTQPTQGTDKQCGGAAVPLVTSLSFILTLFACVLF